jgi:hypothetical protein
MKILLIALFAVMVSTWPASPNSVSICSCTRKIQDSVNEASRYFHHQAEVLERKVAF